MSDVHRIGRSRRIGDKAYVLMTTAATEEEAAAAARAFRSWLRRGSEVQTIAEDGAYLVYVRNAPTPQLFK